MDQPEIRTRDMRVGHIPTAKQALGEWLGSVIVGLIAFAYGLALDELGALKGEE